ncbi:CMRF35-like molecule 6 [Glossophaga mutica]
MVHLGSTGSLSLRGPGNVTGTAGGSLSVSCRYREEYKRFAEYLRRQLCSPFFSETVETSASGGEVRSGRVSIPDHPGNLPFTVTLENLTASDAGKYRCGISTILVGDGLPGFSPDPLFQVQVFVSAGPSCLSLSGPRIVRGTVGGSLSVQCRYEEEFRGNKKYWCEGPCSRLVKSKIVETTESEREVRNGRVSIRDHPANLTFTVTMERLTEGDEGTYWCGIDVSWPQRVLDPNFKVDVIVSPAPMPTWKIFTSTLGPPSSLPVTTLLSTTRPETPDSHQHPRSLLSSVHFLLLVFLKLPLFLSMVGAVLWVNRPQRGSGQGRPPRSENR